MSTKECTPTPKIGTSHAAFRNFEYDQYRITPPSPPPPSELELLMEEFVYLTCMWGLLLYPQ